VKVGALVVILSLVFGCTFGIVAGYFGGSIDIIIMRLIDILLAFPGFLLALALVATLGSSLSTVILAISIAYFPRMALVIRSITLSLRENVYIEAARSLGGSNCWILIRHVFPNAFPPLIVVATISAALAITAEASLSFLGLGVQPPTPTWGAVISDGRAFVRGAPWISISSGFVIMLAVMSLNLFGDALRDVLDPKMKGSMKNV
jgi:peptide/nickel transport system permease protein